jgi:hypothetical protein
MVCLGFCRVRRGTCGLLSLRQSRQKQNYDEGACHWAHGRHFLPEFYYAECLVPPEVLRRETEMCGTIATTTVSLPRLLSYLKSRVGLVFNLLHAPA